MSKEFSDQPPNEDYEDLPVCERCGKRAENLSLDGDEWVCDDCYDYELGEDAV